MCFYHICRYLLKVIKGGFQSVCINVQNYHFLQPTTPHSLMDGNTLSRRQPERINLINLRIKLVGNVSDSVGAVPLKDWCGLQSDKAWAHCNRKKPPNTLFSVCTLQNHNILPSIFCLVSTANILGRLKEDKTNLQEAF